MDSFVSFRESFYKLVEGAERVVITAHLSPDDDSIASVMSLHEILTTKYPGKDIKIVYEAEPTVRHNVFAHYAAIGFVASLAEHLDGVDVLVVLDVNNFARISKQPEVLQTVPNKVVIDHHASTPDDFTLALIDKTYSSNAELVYRIFANDVVLTKTLAESLLLGVLGDTGNLAYVAPEKADTFDLTKTLVQTAGVSINAFRARYGGIPRRIIPLLQELVQHTAYMTQDGWPDMQYTYIASEGEYSDEDMSAASHIYMSQYLTRVEGYGWGVVVTPRSDHSTRISARSLPGSVNVRDLFERMSIGGGHDRAAGGYMKDIDAQTTVQKIFDWMKENKPLLG